jgi:hypothetical protein
VTKRPQTVETDTSPAALCTRALSSALSERPIRKTGGLSLGMRELRVGGPLGAHQRHWGQVVGPPSELLLAQQRLATRRLKMAVDRCPTDSDHTRDGRDCVLPLRVHLAHDGDLIRRQ